MPCSFCIRPLPSPHTRSPCPSFHPPPLHRCTRRLPRRPCPYSSRQPFAPANPLKTTTPSGKRQAQLLSVDPDGSRVQVIYRKPTGSPGGNTSSVSTKNIRVHPFSGDCSFRVPLEKGEAVSRQPVVVVGGMHMGRVGYTKEGYVGAASVAVTLLNSGTGKEDVDERGNVLPPVLQVKDLSRITPEQINAGYMAPPHKWRRWA